MNITEKEIEKVSALIPFERYKYFIKRVADYQLMYTLVDEDNNMAISSVDDIVLVSFWSAKDFAQKEAFGEWKNYKVKEIGIHMFYTEVVNFLTENAMLINIFPVDGKSGFVVDVFEFIRDLEEEMEKYE